MSSLRCFQYLLKQFFQQYFIVGYILGYCRLLLHLLYICCQVTVSENLWFFIILKSYFINILLVSLIYVAGNRRALENPS